MNPSLPEVRVSFPRALGIFYGIKTTEVSLFAANVRDLLHELRCQFPEIFVRLCDEQERPRPHINVFVNDDHICTRDGLATSLDQGDLVSLIPAVSGG